MRRIDPIREQVERDVFTNREKMLERLWEWAMRIPRGAAESTALLSQRRMGKTAVLERLYNRLFWEQEEVIPIFYSVRRENKTLLKFAQEYYASFVAQYLAFKLKDLTPLEERTSPVENLLPYAEKLRDDHIIKGVQGFTDWTGKVAPDHVWKFVVEAPHRLAHFTERYVAVIIDEFQLLA